MTDHAASRRLPMIAVVLAGGALVLTAIAVAVVVGRNDAPAPAAQAPTVSPVLDRRIAASDVIKLKDSLESVVDSGQPKGVRVADAALATALGLEDGDVLTALSGRPTMRDDDVRTLLASASRADVITLYAELSRNGSPVLMRWQLDGDLREARYAAPDLVTGRPTSSVPAAPDPLVDTIVKVDDTHYQVPRSTVDVWLANPAGLARGGRIVPSVKNGKPNGFKLYAIRPSSIFAHLGLANGDTVHSINGFALDSPDDALAAYTRLKNSSTLVIELSRRGTPVTNTIEITK